MDATERTNLVGPFNARLRRNELPMRIRRGRGRAALVHRPSQIQAIIGNQQFLDKKSPRFSTEGLRPTALFFLLINAQIAASYMARAGPLSSGVETRASPLQR